MKRFVCLFVCVCMFICCAFATTNASWNSEVKVNATVGTISVSDAATDASAKGEKLYDLFGGMESFASANKGIVDSGKDISEEDVSVYFRVHQNSKVKTQETVTLTLIAGPLYFNGITSGTVADKTATDVPTVSNIQGNPQAGVLSVSSTNVGTNSFKFSVEYLDKTTAVADRDIGYFLAKWTHVEGLQNGAYSASITMVLETV